MCFVSSHGKRVGILTSGDIRRALLSGDIDEIRVEEIFNRTPAIVEPDHSAYEVRVMMQKLKLPFLVVAVQQELIGIVVGIDI